MNCFGDYKKSSIFAPAIEKQTVFEKVTIAKWNDLVAQLVEQMTLNHWVEGSSPSQVTQRKNRLTR